MEAHLHPKGSFLVAGLGRIGKFLLRRFEVLFLTVTQEILLALYKRSLSRRFSRSSWRGHCQRSAFRTAIRAKTRISR